MYFLWEKWSARDVGNPFFGLLVRLQCSGFQKDRGVALFLRQKCGATVKGLVVLDCTEISTVSGSQSTVFLLSFLLISFFKHLYTKDLAHGASMIRSQRRNALLVSKWPFRDEILIITKQKGFFSEFRVFCHLHSSESFSTENASLLVFFFLLSLHFLPNTLTWYSYFVIDHVWFWVCYVCHLPHLKSTTITLMRSHRSIRLPPDETERKKYGRIFIHLWFEESTFGIFEKRPMHGLSVSTNFETFFIGTLNLNYFQMSIILPRLNTIILYCSVLNSNITKQWVNNTRQLQYCALLSKTFWVMGVMFLWKL